MAEHMARRLGERYEVRSLIGRGGMAEVHLGFDTRLSRIVAIKMLREELAKDSVFQARFRREAQSAASLNHPNIVGVYDTGEDPVVLPGGHTLAVPYIVMEYVEGHTVKDLLADGTPVPIDEAIDIISGVLSALEYSHSKGLVHRDIKPGNVMLTTQGEVKVMDFGIARALTDSQSTMTQTNAVVGTAQYLSPEQARGEQVDTRSDLYSTGVVLFELLTGQPPFKGDSAVSVAYQHVQQLPPTPSHLASDIPEALDRIVMKAMAKNPDDRYVTASSMKADLIRMLSGSQVTAPETSVWASQTTQMLPTPASGPHTSMFSPQGTQVMTAVPSPETPEKKKRGPVILSISLIVIALCMIMAIVWALSGGQSTQSATAVVPNVVSMTQQEAKTTLEAAGFKWKLGEPEPSDTVPAESVARTDPPGGDNAEVGSTVTLFLSSGPNSVKIPDGLIGMTPDEAKAAVEALGLVWKLSDTKEASDDVAEGKIVRVNPSSGGKVKVGSTVTGYVSSGSEKVLVPDLSGMTQDQAREVLRSAGLSFGNVLTKNSSTVAEGRVISTEPAAGTELKKGDEVGLTLSDGKVTIPTGLIGAQKDAVIRSLVDELGLTVTASEHYDVNADAGVVTQLSVAEGSQIPQGSKVTIMVSKGPKPEEQPRSSSSRN
ncbi:MULTISPECIES: Stk1 family PASTA domain-containing Ser/Thr kinase [unclassified Schaalia]|uniref:Stk1 family PASTA domain-containing Ser/Thr kinase n=1 Tax=unclassified Schaalia TaxID=2691889 RepID=UPI001E616D70|nr:MULTISPECIES: Stk1 family PASTA domain-containing Ser/Thr kinase [unclassified Schaalia]MCD4550025.1 Stk1 family PASTA domain-containing Ser/Thr kinase [Schaalia sp. lx-260]MCD4557907.1 Stk1 family PASTA domain-containing Ser/Thr kinase [Schaalia sp. lx-100]